MKHETKDQGTRLLVKVSDAGVMLGIGRSTVYELIARGEIETVRIGRCCRIPAAALDEFVRRLRGTDGASPEA